MELFNYGINVELFNYRIIVELVNQDCLLHCTDLTKDDYLNAECEIIKFWNYFGIIQSGLFAALQ